ncbi:MAG: DUF6285 domain-containing protein [Burkholderiales bacterium]|nr:DUF6285 domain-containing protein [Burkholderiales bacterium]
METTPGAAELIEAAIESIRTELLPALTGRAAFQARVVLTVLDTARREVLDAPAADAAELARLRGLLGADTGRGAIGAGTAAAAPAAGTDAAPRLPDLPTLRRTLCEAIREGRVDLDTPGLAAHLWADVLARVAIDQPSYPSFVREAAPANDRTRD